MTAVAKDLQLKLQSVLRLGLALEDTLTASRIEKELGTLLAAASLRRSVLADHVQVLSEGLLPREEAQRHLGYLLEGQLEVHRTWREYLRVEVMAGGNASGGSGEWEFSSEVRSRVCGWLKALCKRSERAARESPPLLQVPTGTWLCPECTARWRETEAGMAQTRLIWRCCNVSGPRQHEDSSRSSRCLSR